MGASPGLRVSQKSKATLKPPDAPQVVVVLVGKLVAVPVAGAVLSRAVLFGPGKYVALSLFRRALWILDNGRLDHVEGQILLFADERSREHAVLNAGEFGDLLEELAINEDGARGVR